MLEAHDIPLEAMPYLVEVTVANWAEGPASVIGVSAATGATIWLVHVPVLDDFTLLYMVLGGNSIHFFQASFQVCFQANFLSPLN